MSCVFNIVLLAKELKSRSDNEGECIKAAFTRLIAAIVLLLGLSTSVLGCMYCPMSANDLYA